MAVPCFIMLASVVLNSTIQHDIASFIVPSSAVAYVVFYCSMFDILLCDLLVCYVVMFDVFVCHVLLCHFLLYHSLPCHILMLDILLCHLWLYHL